MKKLLTSTLVGIFLTLSSQTLFKNSYLKSQSIVNSYRFSSSLPDGLVAYYPFSGDANDVSGNEYDGTVINGYIGDSLDRFERSNECYYLNGTNANINIDTALSALATDTEGTWAGWFKALNSTYSDYLISFCETSGATRLILFKRTTGIISLFCANTSNQTQLTYNTDTTGVLSDSEWTHIALSQSISGLKIYINGLLVSGTYTNSTNTSAWFNDFNQLDNGNIGVGKYNDLLTAYMQGSIDDIMIFNRALNGDEILTVKNYSQ